MITNPEQFETDIRMIIHTSVDDGRMTITNLENGDDDSAYLISLFYEAKEREEDTVKPRAALLKLLDAAIRRQEKALAAEEAERSDTSEEETAEAEAEAEEIDTAPVIAEQVAPLDRFTPHPDLHRIAMIEDARKFMQANHHGDARRKEVAEELEAEWEAFVDEIRENGVLEPVKVIPGKKGTWIIVDGRHRWQAATDAGLEELPFVEVDIATARAIMEGTIAARRNYSKGQKAFAAVIFHPELLENKPGPKDNSRTECTNSDREIVAQKYGISLRLLCQSIELHQKIKGKKRVAHEVELQVWSGLGLGGILSGLGGKEATESKERRPSDPYSAERSLRSLASQVAKFDQWSADDRKAFADDVETRFAEAPESFKRLFAAILTGDEEAVEFAIREGGAA